VTTVPPPPPGFGPVTTAGPDAGPPASQSQPTPGFSLVSGPAKDAQDAAAQQTGQGEDQPPQNAWEAFKQSVLSDPVVQAGEGFIKGAGQTLTGAADTLNRISNADWGIIPKGNVNAPVAAKPVEQLDKFKNWINAPSESVPETVGTIVENLGEFMSGEELLDVVGKGPGALKRAADLEKFIAANPKIGQLLRVGTEVAKHPGLRNGVLSAIQTYIKSGGDTAAAGQAGAEGLVLGTAGHEALPAAFQFLKKYLGPYAQDILSRLETSPEGKTTVRPKPPKLTDAQTAELERRNLLYSQRVGRTEAHLATRQGAAATRASEIEAATAARQENAQAIEAGKQAALQRAGQEAEGQEAAQQVEGQAAIRQSAQGAATRNLEEINQSLTREGGPEPTFNIRLPHAQEPTPLPSTVTGEPVYVRTAHVPGEGTMATPADQYQGDPNAPYATTYPPATVTHPEGPLGEPRPGGEIPTRDPITARRNLIALNNAIHDPDDPGAFDRLPLAQKNYIIDAHNDIAQQIDQYDRWHQATGGTGMLFEPINIPEAVKNLGSHSEAADLLHDVVTRGYDEIATRSGHIGQSEGTYTSLKNDYQTAEQGVRQAEGTRALGAAEAKQEAAHQALQDFLRRDVKVDPSQVSQLDHSYKNYLVMRDVGNAVDGAFHMNPYLAKNSTLYNSYTGDGLLKALDQVTKKHGYAQVERVIGADNLRTLQAVAEKTSTVEGSKQLGQATDAINKAYSELADQEGQRLKQATAAAKAKYTNTVGPARQQYLKEVEAAKQAENLHRAQMAAADQKAKAYYWGKHIGLAGTFSAGAGLLGHMTGLPYAGPAAAGIATTAYAAGAYKGAAAWNYITSHPNVAKTVLYAIDHEVPLNKMGQIIARTMMAEQRQSAVEDARQRQQQEQQPAGVNPQ
jgi:hypothetical protein